MDTSNTTAEADQTSQQSPFSTAPQPPAAPPVPPPEQPNEREVLMSRARLMGIEFSNNIGTETLRARIKAKLDGETKPEEPAVEDGEINALTGEPVNVPKKSLRQQIYEEQMKLVRIRITCMDPKKKDLPGEIFTIANEYLGTVRKFVPFGEVTDDGFHVPYCIYTMLEERRFLNIRTRKDKRTGVEHPETSWAREFAIEILPPLTPDELKRLAIAQAAAGSIDPGDGPQ